MAILHKLTLALRHLDSDNSLWKNFQKEAAIKRSENAYDKAISQSQRDQELLEISKIFELYSGDFGRKLYLIQNSIYGVDIQAIACQIAKLRFFISLTIEQVPHQELPNFGIKPLPNLETRFVVANTLLPFERQGTFNSDRVLELQSRLLHNRERHFHANERREKLELMQTDRELRSELGEELTILNFPPNVANQLVCWDPYDQNDVASWFDPWYMFGIQRGFDIVIGNPPYISLQKGVLGDLYEHVGYQTYARSGDIYQLFFERGCSLLRKGGVLAYITSSRWMNADYGGRLRKFLSSQFTPLYLLDMGEGVFEANVDTNILVLQNTTSASACKQLRGTSISGRIDDKTFPPPRKQWAQIRPNRTDVWRILTALEWDVLEKMQASGTPLKDWADISIYRGITTGYNDAFLVDRSTRERLIAEDARSEEILKPLLKGCDIQRYRAKCAGRWLITTFPSLGLEIENYPAIKKYLLSHGRDRLAQTGKPLPDGQKARKKTKHQWFELQDTCAYQGDFYD